jgi:hypothetical protein
MVTKSVNRASWFLITKEDLKLEGLDKTWKRSAFCLSLRRMRSFRRTTFGGKAAFIHAHETAIRSPIVIHIYALLRSASTAQGSKPEGITEKTRRKRVNCKAVQRRSGEGFSPGWDRGNLTNRKPATVVVG